MHRRLAQIGRIVVVFVALSLTSCISREVLLDDPIPVDPTRPPTSALLIDDTAFPDEWEVYDCNPDCGPERQGQSYRGIGRVTLPGVMGQQVFNFAKEEDAEAKFQRYDETTPGGPRSVIRYRSLFADEQYLRCRSDPNSGLIGCQAGRRYGTYFVYLFIPVENGNNEGLTYVEIEAFLQASDEHIAEVLGLRSVEE